MEHIYCYTQCYNVYNVIRPMWLRLLNLTVVINGINVDVNVFVPADSNHVSVTITDMFIYSYLVKKLTLLMITK